MGELFPNNIIDFKFFFLALDILNITLFIVMFPTFIEIFEIIPRFNNFDINQLLKSMVLNKFSPFIISIIVSILKVSTFQRFGLF